jgi:hypothetical protein
MTDAIAVSIQPARDAPNQGEVQRLEHLEPRCQPDRERWKDGVKRDHECDGRSEKRNGVIAIINAPQRQRLERARSRGHRVAFGVRFVGVSSGAIRRAFASLPAMLSSCVTSVIFCTSRPPFELRGRDSDVVRTHAEKPFRADNRARSRPLWGEDDVLDLADVFVLVVVDGLAEYLVSRAPSFDDVVSLNDGHTGASLHRLPGHGHPLWRARAMQLCRRGAGFAWSASPVVFCRLFGDGVATHYREHTTDVAPDGSGGTPQRQRVNAYSSFARLSPSHVIRTENPA